MESLTQRCLFLCNGGPRVPSVIKASGSHHLVMLQERLLRVRTHTFPGFMSKWGGVDLDVTQTRL